MRLATKIGMAERVITGPVGCRLSGYADQRESKGVHDELYVRCLVLESASTSVAILAVSVVSLCAEATNHIRVEVSRLTGIPIDHIVVHATHTHSAPELTDAYTAFVVERCAVCAEDAWANRFAGRIGVGVTTVDQAGKNRRYLDYGGVPVDPQVGVIKLEDAEGILRGVVINYACHPTTLGAQNTLMTEDWPHFALQHIKQNTGANVVAMFLNGACGDINPGYSAALSAVNAEIPIRTWTEAERIGERIANAALSQLEGIKTRHDAPVKVAYAEVDLPKRTTFPISEEKASTRLDEARKRLAAMEAESQPFPRAVERARADVFLAELLCEGTQTIAKEPGGGSLTAGLQSILINDAVLSTLPGEVFVEIGLDVKQRSPFPKTLIVELVTTAEAEGYMPSASAFGDGDYEVFSSDYAESAGHVLVEAILANIGRVAG